MLFVEVLNHSRGLRFLGESNSSYILIREQEFQSQQMITVD
jgi:hypothetical protein